MRRQVIPEVFKSVPTVAVPTINNDSLDTLKVLKEAIRCFDKEIISRAFFRSFKIAKNVLVKGQKNYLVPRESIYDTELNRILVNWIVKQNSYEVISQWHMIENHVGEKDKHYYSDIIIKKLSQTIIIELLATSTKSTLSEQFSRVLKYADNLSASEIWIIHFTCEDNATLKPHYPLNNEEFERLNIVHFLHNEKFDKVQMSAQLKNTFDVITYINNEQIIP